jgi:hypothetical protein
MMGGSKEREGGHAEAMLQPCCTSHDAVPAQPRAARSD